MKTRHVVITGGSSGFGWSMAENFLRDGDIVHVTTRGTQIEQIASLPPECRNRVKVYQLDLLSTASRENFVKAIRAGLPQLDVLINNAGFGLFGALEDLSEEQIRRQMEVNFTGTVLLTQALLPMLRASRGRIINFSSALGFSGLPMTSLYCASKFALEGWSESLKYELEPHGVKVTVVEPGAHRTKFGASVEWGTGTQNQSSPYANGSNNYKRLLEKVRTRKNPSRPESVADRVTALVNSSHPPVRIRCGPDAHATYWARQLLPMWLYHAISRIAFRKVFFSPAARAHALPQAQV